MIIMNSSKKIIVIGKVCLKPGNNVITSAEVVKMKPYKAQFELIPALDVTDGSFTPRAKKTNVVTNAPLQESVISELSDRKALSVVKKTVDRNSLIRLLEDEEANSNRSKVINAIKKQLEVFDTGTEVEIDK